MRILFLAQRVPYPPDRGDRITSYHYIRHLARNHDVVVACLLNEPGDARNAAALAHMVAGVEAVPLSRTRARLRAASELAMGTRPLTVAYLDEPELRQRVRKRVAEGFDLAILHSSGMASYVDEFSDLPRVIQFADLDSQKWRLYSDASRFPKRWLYRNEADRLFQYERHIAQTFDCSLFCSTRDLADFRRLIPSVPAQCIRNGVDLEYFKSSGQPKDPQNLIFTGVMSYRPNVDGMLWFCREVLPRIQSEAPGATLTICGSSPNKQVRELARKKGVSVTGGVPDVRPYLARSSVAVVPLQLARGIQNKILEAMAMSLPTVTTSAAFEGLEAEKGRDLLVADDPGEFAASVVRLLHDSRLRVKIGMAARATVEAHYHWDQSLAQLDDVIAAVAGDRSPTSGPTVASGIA